MPLRKFDKYSLASSFSIEIHKLLYLFLPGFPHKWPYDFKFFRVLFHLRCQFSSEGQHTLFCAIFFCRQIDLPDFDKLRREANMSPDELRAHMKREGILPPRTFQERDIIIASTSMQMFTDYS